MDATTVIHPSQVSGELLADILGGSGFDVAPFSGRVEAGFGVHQFNMQGAVLARLSGHDVVVCAMAGGNVLKIVSFYDYAAFLGILQRYELLMYFMQDIIVARAYDTPGGFIALDSFVPVIGGITVQAMVNAVYSHIEICPIFVSKCEGAVVPVALS